jgi:two-component system sensor histidine kinase KdpD
MNTMEPFEVEQTQATLILYLGSVPGVGKTHRLLEEGITEMQRGKRVAIGWIEVKGRPRLDELAARLPQIAPKHHTDGTRACKGFDLEAALASDAQIILLDELAQENPRGSLNAKRWQDVLALLDAGKSVFSTCNIAHFENIAPFAERVTGFPIREIIPMHVLSRADQVTAIDVSIEVLQQRLSRHEITRPEDVRRAAEGILRPSVLHAMRELLLRTLDDMASPNVTPNRVSSALGIALLSGDPSAFTARVAAVAESLSLLCEVAGEDHDTLLSQVVLDLGVRRIPLTPLMRTGDLHEVAATLVAIPNGPLAQRIVRMPSMRSVFIVDAERGLVAPVGKDGAHFKSASLRRGSLTVYLGSVAGSGKTYAMLARAQQLRDSQVDVVGAFIETHGRSETHAMIGDLPLIARTAAGDMDLDSVMQRRPRVALVDECAHTNALQAKHRKRYEEIAVLLAAGIDVITTLNVQHVEGVGAAVERLTGTHVRETVPDSLLENAAEVIFIDVTSEVLQQRLRDGKIYPAARVETALANFFRFENLVGLRELAVRELLRARASRQRPIPFARILLGIAPSETEEPLIVQAAQFAKRMRVPFWVFCITPNPLIPSLHERFSQFVAKVDGIFIHSLHRRPAEAFAALAGTNDLLTIASPREARTFFKKSFAMRCLEAGAKELLVLAPPCY